MRAEVSELRYEVAGFKHGITTEEAQNARATLDSLGSGRQVRALAETIAQDAEASEYVQASFEGGPTGLVQAQMPAYERVARAAGGLSVDLRRRARLLAAERSRFRNPASSHEKAVDYLIPPSPRGRGAGCGATPRARSLRIRRP